MKNYNDHSQVQSAIVNSGLVVKKSPSVDYPIPVTLAYRVNPDGSLRWLFPEGGNSSDFSRFYMTSAKDTQRKTRVNSFLFALGLGRFISNGRTIIYTDLPTATFITTQWKNN